MKPPLLFCLRCRVRRAVLASSHGPMLTFYLLMYRAAMFVVRRRLCAFPEVQALYLRRGAGKGEITPGVSDLDFAVVVSEGRGEAVRRAYAQLAGWIPFLDKGLHVYDLPTLYERAEQAPGRYRFAEARNNWKLLAGRDCLRDLPDWPVEEMWAGLSREIKVWVSLFIEHLIVHPYRRHDDVFRNSLCVKVLGELNHLDQAWSHGRLSFSRRKAWRSLPPAHPWRGPVEQAEKERFSSTSWDLAEFTWRELLLWVDRFSRQLPTHPYGVATPFVNIDLPSPPAYLGFPLGQAVRFLPIDPHNPPRLMTLRRQDAYLAWNWAALSLDTRVSCDEMLFTPSQNPELFDGLVGWSQMFQEFFYTRWGDEAELPGGTICPNRFWMSCRMAISYLELGRGNLVVLDSPQALSTRLAAEGFPIPGDNGPAPGYLFRLWDRLREGSPKVARQPKRLPRALAVVANFKWSHTDYLVALGRHLNLTVAACGEVHMGAIANAARWKISITDIGPYREDSHHDWMGRLHALVVRHRPEVVHVMYYHHEELVPLLRELVGPECRLVFECRDPISALRPGVQSALAAEARALCLADGYIVVSRAMRDYYRNLHNLAVEPCLVVPHAYARRTIGVEEPAKLSSQDGRLHLALVGSAYLEPDTSRYYGHIIEELAGAGVVVHSHFHAGPGDDFYGQLSQKISNYHCHPTVPFREETLLSDLMARYDLMGVFHQLDARASSEAEILSICLPTKAVSGWFHGGIPVVCYAHYRGVLNYLEDFSAGFVVARPSEVAHIDRLELSEAGARVRANRDFFTHEHHAARIAQFVHKLLESKRCVEP